MRKKRYYIVVFFDDGLFQIDEYASKVIAKRVLEHSILNGFKAIMFDM